MSVVRDDYCPVCYSKTTYEIYGKKDEWFPVSENLYPVCKECGWRGKWDEVIDENEAKSFKRLKIIDKALNETK